MDGIIIFSLAGALLIGAMFFLAARVGRPARLVFLESTELEAEANHWALRLRARGVRCEVHTVNVGIDAYEFSFYSWQVWVRPRDLARASKILASVRTDGSLA